MFLSDDLYRIMAFRTQQVLASLLNILKIQFVNIIACLLRFVTAADLYGLVKL